VTKFTKGLSNPFTNFKKEETLKTVFNKVVSLTIFTLLGCQTLFAQSAGSGESNVFLISMAIGLALVLLFAFLFVADGLLQVEAKNAGTSVNLSVWPTSDELAPRRVPKDLANDRFYNLKKGFDLNLDGSVVDKVVQVKYPKTVAVQPTNFLGIAPIPKLEVEVGSKVKAGDSLFFDKSQPEVKYCAPVSGEVVAINRGAKRAIAEVVIALDENMEYKRFEVPSLEEASREEILSFLAEAGMVPLIKRRPYNTVPSLQEIPRDIFISTFDSAPLSPNLGWIAEGQEAYLQMGVDVLGKLTSGKVHLGLNGKDLLSSAPFLALQGVERAWFKGAHPAGNVGVQIHHVSPLGSNDVVWTLGVQELITIGKLFREGVYSSERTIALAGACVSHPKYIKTYLGACIADLTEGESHHSHCRIISGNVLTGEQKEPQQFLNAFDSLVSVIEEGDYYEMFGWLLPLKPRPSISNTFPTKLIPGMTFAGDTNTHGEKRAFVVTGEYEKVLPMDIYVQQLMKAIMVENFEKMEGLGIYELVEEDVALCEFACTSKQPLQKILREGLNFMQAQG
jgi:Na+-transporting NADH:ubiquinone oxidoreductase subunit A